MSQGTAKSPKQLSEEVDFLTGELERLTAEVVRLRREQRADRDRLALGHEAIERFLLEAHPDLGARYQEIREKVRLEVSPE